MKKIKVYLQKTWKFSDSPYYIYLRKEPPSNIEYMNIPKDNYSGLIASHKKLKINNKLKRGAKLTVRKIFPSLPNAMLSRPSLGYDIIHCEHCLSLNKTPWVADIEFVDQFWAGQKSNKNRKKILSLLMGENCKKIMPWSEWSQETILQIFPEIKDKLEIVYPAVPIQNFKKEKKDKIKILFVGRNFKIKGGEVALMVMDKLTKKYNNVEGIVVSEVPKEIYEKYKENEKIEFKGMIPQEKLFKEVYPGSDILLYPTFSDTFGFAILESKSFGLPVVTMETMSTHTIKETIEEGKTGFIIDNSKTDGDEMHFDDKIILKIYEAAERLVKDNKLRERMSKNCTGEIKNGKFSIKKRNEKLKEIYRGALK